MLRGVPSYRLARVRSVVVGTAAALVALLVSPLAALAAFVAWPVVVGVIYAGDVMLRFRIAREAAFERLQQEWRRENRRRHSDG